MLRIRLSVFLIIGMAACSCGFNMDAANGVIHTSREEIPDEYKWDLSQYYDSWDQWENDLARLEELVTAIGAFQGRLSEGPEVLLEALQQLDQLRLLLYKTYAFAQKSSDLDTRDNAIRARVGEIGQLWSKIAPMVSWIEPEILTIPPDTMEQWIDANPRLEQFRFGLMDTYRTSEFILDSDGERLLSLHGAVRAAPGRIYSVLTDADGDRPVVELSTGEEITLTYGTYSSVLNNNPNPADRRAVQEAWMKQYENLRNTFASIYTGVLQQNWVLAQSRGYPSSLSMHLSADNIPEEIVTTLIEAAREGAVELQRYHKLRKAYLGLDNYGWSDVHIPLMVNEKEYKYKEIVPWIINSVSPLGQEYKSKMSEQFTAGFVDVYETPGKRTGAYNSGTYGVGSFVLLNYQSGLDDVFTVAHEMGHSMHARLAMEYQPFSTSDYTIFVAEVASTLNEKLLLRQLLQEVHEPEERIAFLEQQITSIADTYFLQTMMADYEISAHHLLEQGQGLTADKLTDLWRKTVRSYFGDVLSDDDPYMLSWARIPHLYNSPFYVYQYATSYAASSAFMKQMQKSPEAVDRYLNLLKSGGNDYPMDQLRRAGVDLSDRRVLTAVTEEFSRLLNLLEMEYNRYLAQRTDG